MDDVFGQIYDDSEESKNSVGDNGVFEDGEKGRAGVWVFAEDALGDDHG